MTTFLGFRIKFTNYENILCLKISALLVSPSPTIREVAQAIGYIVSNLPAVKYGKCHYRAIENNKISALKEVKGNFDPTMCLSTSAVAELEWWVNHLPTSFHFIQAPVIDCAISSEPPLLVGVEL